jgi:glycosyltransferase involved in cell wall biosynthesis
MQTICGAMICYNEEKVISVALDSLKRITDQINIVDSISTDKTMEILSQYKCNVIQHPIDNFRDQKNRALEMCKADWIFIIDADEYLDEKLIKSIPELINNTENIDAYSIPRKNYIGGDGPLGYPDYQTKLFKNNVRFVGNTIHEGVLPSCKKHVVVSNAGSVIHEKTWKRQEKQNRLYYSMRPGDYKERPRGAEENDPTIGDKENVDIYKDYLSKTEEL